MPQSRIDFQFSSEILGRRQLDGRLPVLLIKAPKTLKKQQRRGSFRISAALKARVEWT
jgi:c-di-GMP-binding flagellar brake protein YcgR